VYVATDSGEIACAVQEFGGKTWMTGHEHQNGTERVAEVAEAMVEVDVFVGWQADEPEINPHDVTRLIENCIGNTVWTLSAPITKVQSFDPSRTKVVVDDYGNAMYFSRSSIPWNSQVEDVGHWQHIGIYVYRSRTLRLMGNLPPNNLEGAELLEQLRWLAYGWDIKVVQIKVLPNGINTREDYDAFVQRQKVMA
jgi:3-deoxy-manno-octulosonate cytidylyltransferase (CMP-KDO synthetase)